MFVNYNLRIKIFQNCWLFLDFCPAYLVSNYSKISTYIFSNSLYKFRKSFKLQKKKFQNRVIGNDGLRTKSLARSSLLSAVIKFIDCSLKKPFYLPWPVLVRSSLLSLLHRPCRRKWNSFPPLIYLFLLKYFCILIYSTSIKPNWEIKV